jgi:transcriptional regulator with XRE-family HTH domain
VADAAYDHRASLPKRRVFTKEIGDYFVALREARGWGQSHAADLAARRRLGGISYQTLRGIEEGTTKHIDPETLRALAALYDRPYEEVATRYVALRYGRDLLSQVAEQEMRHADQARARVVELERRLAEAQTVSQELQAIAHRILAIAAPPAQPRESAGRVTKRHREA